MPFTVRISFPSSLSGVKPIKGYFLLDAGISSTVRLSSSFRLEVACFDFDLLAENLSIKAFNSFIFPPLFILLFYHSLHKLT